MNIRTIVLFIVLFGGTLFIGPFNSNISSQNDTTIEIPQVVQDLVTYNYRDPLIESYIETGEFPSIVDNNGILVVSHAPISYLDNIIPPIKIQGTYLYMTKITDQQKLKQLNLDNNVKSILPNYLINYTVAQSESPKIGTQSFLAKDILRTADVWTDFGIDGTGVKIGVTDSGVDFGISDLSDAAHLTSTGITSSFDPTGAGLGLSNLTLQAVNSADGLVLPLSQHNITIWMAEELGYTTTGDIGIRLEDLRIDGISKPSVSGNYKVGIMFEPGYQETIVNQFFIFVLTDSVTPGVYDTIYVDFSTSLGISLERDGIILESGPIYLGYVDWDLIDETPFGFGSPILARDFDGDGINDVSMGALSTTFDIYGVVISDPFSEGVNVKGIHSNGKGIAVMYDPIGHGTLVASAAAADGDSGMLLFDEKDTTTVENDTAYYLPGSAPGASIIATKGIAIDDFVLGWYWTAGFEIVVSGNSLVWDTSPSSINHRVDISSNSWGSGQIAFTGSVKGMDYYSLLLDAFSAPNLLYDNYPGIIFVVASGNSGPGYGTIATPGAASMAITVGASSYYHFLDNPGKNDVAFFTSRGPTPYGGIKPDIVTPGNTGYTHYQVNTGYGNGTRAAGTFGGTSEATPRASGIVALIIQAMKDTGITPNLGNVRVALKSNAVDLGFHPTIQGAGLANAYGTISSILNDEKPHFQTNSTALYIGERLNTAFGSLFVDDNENPLNHPYLNNPYDDTFVITNSSMLLDSELLKVVSINGSSIDETLMETSVDRIALAESSSFTFETEPQVTTNVNLADLWSLSNNWQEYEFMQISISLIEESWDLLVDYGISTPDLILFDSSTENIVFDLISQLTWTQQMYSGFPINDFQGDPILQLDDPGVELEITGWPGLFYNVTVLTYDYIDSSRIAAVPQANGINITASTQGEFEFNTLFVTFNNTDTYNIPILLAEEEIVKYAEDASIISQSLDSELPYDLNTYFGSLDWGYRPESGDFRFYYLHVPSNATFLAIHAAWVESGFIPDLYLFDETGVLVTTSDVEYLGGGFYESETSEEFAQNLLIPTDGQHYTLLVHVAHMPFSSEPVDLSILTRYLTVTSIPAPQINFQPPLNEIISGPLTITSSDFDLDEFPELHVDHISAQIMQGVNGTVNGTIIDREIVHADPVSLGGIEATEDLSFEQGEKVRLEVKWDQNVDIDLYVLKQGENFFLENDLLSLQGTSTAKNSETAIFSIDSTGNYTIYIDVVAGSLSDDVEYALSWDSRDGPTIESETSELVFDSGIFPNGEFQMKIDLFTNFNTFYTEYFTLEISNYLNFTSEILSPSGGKVSGDVSVSWSSSWDVTANIYLVIESIEIIVKQGITDTQTSFNSRLYQNGPSTLEIHLTDGVFSHTHMVQIEIDNSDTSSLPPRPNSNDRNLNNSLFLISIPTIFLLIILRKMKNVSR